MIGKADFLFNSLGPALQREIDSEGAGDCKEATTKTYSKLRCSRVCSSSKAQPSTVFLSRISFFLLGKI